MVSTLTIMSGLPRSGKSTWANQHAYKVVICADRLRFLVYNQRFWDGGEPLMWSIHGIILRLMLEQRVDVIIDECNVTPKRRFELIKIAREYNYETECVIVGTPFEECMNRAKHINDLQIQPVIERMAKEYITPSYSEGFDYIWSLYNGDLELIEKNI